MCKHIEPHLRFKSIFYCVHWGYENYWVCLIVCEAFGLMLTLYKPYVFHKSVNGINDQFLCLHSYIFSILTKISRSICNKKDFLEWLLEHQHWQYLQMTTCFLLLPMTKCECKKKNCLQSIKTVFKKTFISAKYKMTVNKVLWTEINKISNMAKFYRRCVTSTI